MGLRYRVIAPCKLRDAAMRPLRELSPGDVVDLPVAEAERLARAGCIEVEEAVVEAAENRIVKRGRKRGHTDSDLGIDRRAGHG